GLVDYRTDPRTSYRVGNVESSDGLQWERKPVPAGLDRSADGWDSVMLTYTSLLRVSGKMLCFYKRIRPGPLRLRGGRSLRGIPGEGCCMSRLIASSRFRLPGLLRRRPTLEVHVPMSPTPSFLYQLRCLTHSLRRFGGAYRDSPVIATVGGEPA